MCAVDVGVERGKLVVEAGGVDVRAVGTANGMNRLSILVPCHRVVNTNGELGGYGGGLWRKRLLLDLEKGQRTPAPLVRYTANVPSQ